MSGFNVRAALGMVALVIGGGVLFSSASAQTIEAARAALPEGIRSSNTINVAGTFSWPPFSYIGDAGTPVGLDIELLEGINERLGLKPEFTTVKTTAIALVQTGRADMAVGQLGITKTRLDAVNFVPYLKSGWRLLVRKGDASKYSAESMCGLELSVTQGTSQIAIIDAISKKCVADGKPAIVMSEFQNTPASFLALEGGRGDGYLVSEATSVYLASTKASLEIAPGQVADPTIYSGFAISKDNPALAKAITMALEAMADDGSYNAVFEKYGIPGAALTKEQFLVPVADLALDQ